MTSHRPWALPGLYRTPSPEPRTRLDDGWTVWERSCSKEWEVTISQPRLFRAFGVFALQRCPGSGTLRQDDVKLVTSLVVSTVLSHTNTNPRFHFKMPQACGCIWTAACCTVCPSLLSGFLPPYEQFSSPQIRTCMRSESLQKTMPPARRVSLLATVVAVVD